MEILFLWSILRGMFHVTPAVWWHVVMVACGGGGGDGGCRAQEEARSHEALVHKLQLLVEWEDRETSELREFYQQV